MRRLPLQYPTGCTPPLPSFPQVFSERNPWANRFPSKAQFKHFTVLLGLKFKGKKSFPKERMTLWLVRHMIEHHHLHILVAQLPNPHYKHTVLEFISNFKPNNQCVRIRGKYYTIIPKAGVEALQCGTFLQSDKWTCREWLRDFRSKASMKALGENLYCLG